MPKNIRKTKFLHNHAYTYVIYFYFASSFFWSKSEKSKKISKWGKNYDKCNNFY